ncbi:MAG: hypothetical protein V4550_14060 [Gemmatimonadota bacterium]
MLSFAAWLALVVGGANVVGMSLPDGAKGRASVDATFGAGQHSSDGHFYLKDAVNTVDVTVAWHTGATALVSPAFALTVGDQGHNGGQDSICRTNPEGGCLDYFPHWIHYALVGGIDVRESGGSLRLMAGPALFAGNRSFAFGGQAQLDAASPPVSHMALQISVRGSAVARGRESFRLGSLDVGIRIQ